jgi:hypothetical protein
MKTYPKNGMFTLALHKNARVQHCRSGMLYTLIFGVKNGQHTDAFEIIKKDRR